MKESKEKHDFLRVQPDISEVFHYSFCYIGALAGTNFQFPSSNRAVVIELCNFFWCSRIHIDIRIFFFLITGPYYRYRTYYDFINLPYWKYADCQKQTNKRIILAPMAALAFYLMSQIFPHSVRLVIFEVGLFFADNIIL
jgi:hypothetical protein